MIKNDAAKAKPAGDIKKRHRAEAKFRGIKTETAGWACLPIRRIRFDYQRGLRADLTLVVILHQDDNRENHENDRDPRDDEAPAERATIDILVGRSDLRRSGGLCRRLCRSNGRSRHQSDGGSRSHKSLENHVSFSLRTQLNLSVRAFTIRGNLECPALKLACGEFTKSLT
jgi:hypothetical protein